MLHNKAPRAALVSGFWGQNIGNAFFNVGGKWVLEQVFGAEEVAFIQDQPGYRTFNNQRNGNPRNDVGFLRFLEVEYLALQGPLLTTGFPHLWGPTLTALTERGTKLILLGAAFFRFTQPEIEAARKFIERFPPALISTRDNRSFEILKSWGLKIPLYDGIDSAFFAPKAYTPFTTNGVPYYAFTFDRYPEPSISIGEPDQTADRSFERDGSHWNLYTPALVSWFAKRGKSQAYLGHLLDRRKLPSSMDGRTIIRPEHRFNPHMTFKIYQHPNAMASDEPWTYFTAYANTEMTLSDRVHACVATLAYGKPAMLFTPSPRAALFDRMGCSQIRERPAHLDPHYLEDERQKEVAWLKAHV